MLRLTLIFVILACAFAASAQDQTTNRLQGSQPAEATTNNLQAGRSGEPTTTNLANQSDKRRPTTTGLQQQGSPKQKQVLPR